MEEGFEVEASRPIPHWRLLVDQSRITRAVVSHQYNGKGTEEDPFIVCWIPSDPGNPMEFSTFKKWFLSGIAAMCMLATAFTSSAFSGMFLHKPCLLKLTVLQEACGRP
jgi:hypothetical protein